MKANEFTSCMAKRMVRFVDLKCCSGISRKKLVEKLVYFDRFLNDNEFHSQRIDAPIIAQYLEHHVPLVPHPGADGDGG